MWVLEINAGEYQCGQDTSKTCIGKRCMAWRWGYANPVDRPTNNVTYSADEVGVPDDKYPPGTRFRPRKGFCGHAGKPS